MFLYFYLKFLFLFKCLNCNLINLSKINKKQNEKIINPFINTNFFVFITRCYNI